MNELVIGPEEAVGTALLAGRAAASGWRLTPFPNRLRIVARTRRILAARALAVAGTLGDRRPVSDTLGAELLPLLAAARFLERQATALLAPQRARGGRPIWLFGTTAEIRREPWGVVLILGPANFPLFLPGIQVLQALVAGNAVCVKPAPDCAAPLVALAKILTEAGLPSGLLHVLDTDVATGIVAVSAGFDHIVLTGSAATGSRVLALAAETLTPVTAELSGNDAVVILPGADLALVAAALSYGLRLNGGATCIAPRRVFVPRPQLAALEHALLGRIGQLPPSVVPDDVLCRLRLLLDEAIVLGARLLTPYPRTNQVHAVILADAKPQMRLLREDVFAPWLALVPVADAEQALAAIPLCPYALGASVFGPLAAAHAIARQISVGSVCINDVIVPTADPRLSFGGRGRSGSGVTRGPEGLLAMTVIKTISMRRGRFRPHLVFPKPADSALYATMIIVLYGGLRGYWTVARRAWDRVMQA